MSPLSVLPLFFCARIVRYETQPCAPVVRGIAVWRSPHFGARILRMKDTHSGSLLKRIVSFWPYVLMTVSLVGLTYNFLLRSR